MNYSLGIVIPHGLLRNGMEAALEEDSAMKIAFSVGEGEEALSTIDAGPHPDLLIVHMVLPGLSGLEFTKRVLSKTPDLPILLVSPYVESLCGERALQAGAKGFLRESASVEAFVEAVHDVVRMGFSIPDDLQRHILRQYSDGRDKESPPDSLSRLSDRELDIFTELGRGYSLHEIAEKLHVSTNTVQTHQANMKEKLDVESAQKLRHLATVITERERLCMMETPS